MARPFHVMAKPIGPICNLDCAYCYYLSKENLYEGNRRWAMADDLLDGFIREVVSQQSGPEISFAWQGGEPTLLGLKFFERVIEIQRQYAGGRPVVNSLQTNGTLLTDEWGAFFRQHRFLIGLSIDGPEDLHDAYRKTKQGEPTFRQVMNGLEVLKRHHVEFNTLTVVHRQNSQRPLDVYRFLKEIGSRHLQFIPLVERRLPDGTLAPPPTKGNLGPQTVTEWSVEPDAYGEFLVRIFDEWVRRDVARVFVQQFEAALGSWYGTGPGLCVFAPTCGTAIALEHNGDVFSCDHYVYPQYRLGNLKDLTLLQMASSAKQTQFGLEKQTTLPKMCRECDVRFACHGECPKGRFCTTPSGEPGLHYLCPAYLRFFRHIAPAMRRMVELLKAQRSPAEIMQPLKAPRNAPCPCGSGKKFKVCCGRG